MTQSVSERSVSEEVQETGFSRRSEFWRGVRATVPLVVGAIPFGIIFGAVAVSGGLSPQATMAMSLFVFAGSAQFVAAGLFAAGAGVVIIVLTTFVVNLRHALYAASLAPHMKELPQSWLLPLGFWLTDESYLVVIDRYMQEDRSPFKHWFYLGSALFMYINWQICTFIGIMAGQAIPNPESWGLEFALPVTFIGMLVPMLRGQPVIACVLVAGASALLFSGLPNQLGLIIATLLGVATGAILQRSQETA